MPAEKTQWLKLDVANSSAGVQKAADAVEAAFEALEAAITSGAKKKNLIPDGKIVKALQARGGGYIFAYVDPRGSSTGPQAI